MPPKKDKKKKVSRKKIKMAMPDPARFATGYNRQIPGGIIGTGGGGGFVAPSYSVGGYASRMPPPATPIQTPDQFSIIQQQRQTAELIADVEQEQKEQKKRGRRTDEEIARLTGSTVEEIKAERKGKKVPATPLGNVTMTEQMKMPTTPMDMLPPENPPPAMADSNIRKAGKKKKQEVAGDTPASSFASPSVISSPEYPGGQSMFQQGMFMGTPAKLKGSPPDLSTDLDGKLDPIAEPAVFF